MLISGALEKARLYIETHSKDTEPAKRGKFETGPCITLSRETGAGADVISQKTAEILQRHKKENLPNWTVFDKNLIEKVLEDHNLPKTLSNVIEEKRYSALVSFASELLAGQPSIQSLVHKTTHTILSLAEIGNVIIIGRGGNVVTGKMQNTFHIRLVATIDDRISHIKELYNFNDKEAAEFIKKNDQARKDYLRNYFYKQIDDPLLYNMIINTHRFNYDQAAELIASAVMTKFPSKFNLS